MRGPYTDSWPTGRVIFARFLVVHLAFMTARFVASLALVLLALAALCSPGVGRAQRSSVPSTLAGNWRYDGRDAQAMAIVEAAFAPGINTLPELFRGFARDRIRGSMVPPSRATVELTGAHVRITLQTNRTIVIDGELGRRATTSGVEGDTRVTTGLRGGWLEVRYTGEGDMQQLFSTERDGSIMHIDYTIESERLPRPVVYRLDYRHP
jgi:hypothetical protein